MNNTTSLTTLQRIAEQGNANAQFTLGQKYEQGDGVPKNDQQAIKWYRKAAEQDDCDAQFSLARLYEKGTKTIPQSYQQAITWYKRAAEQGDPEAQLFLGRMYETGHEEFPANITEAVHYYKDAAKQGSTEAMRQLAHIYEKMDDAQNAIYWYEQIRYERRITRNLDEATAQHHLGNLYEHGQVVAKDYAQAIHWYQKAAANKHFASYFSLGRLYAIGEGVTQDAQQAKEWLHKAVAVAEDGSDFNSIGDVFLELLHDHSNAILCYEKAVTVDEDDRNFGHIGYVFQVLHDYPNAILCYEKAAAKNHFDSHLSLSELYATGEGVTQNTQQAKEWLHKAVAVAKDGSDFDRISTAFKALHDYSNAVRCYKKAAEKNHFDSHLTLSELYATGEGVTQDTQQAKEWLHKAVAVAKGGWDFDSIGDAFKALHDYPNAILCYEKAAESNHVDSYLALSRLHAIGKGVKQDTQQAKKWLHKAVAVAKDGWDFHKIGDAFKSLNDYLNAILCYEKAAEENDFSSHFTLSKLYATGEGVAQDMQQAKEWLHKAVDIAKHSWNFDKIGNAFKALHDYPNAILCYEKIAEKNDISGHLTLSKLYATGEGVTQDTQQAKEWLHKAVAAENGWDCSIGDAFKALYDYPNAILCYEKAVEKNSVGGYLSLSELYAIGEGVTQDTQQAKEWLHKAVDITKNSCTFNEIGNAFKALNDYSNAIRCYKKAVAVAEDGSNFDRVGDEFKALHDYPNAILCYEKAAENNHFGSHLTLSKLYATGEGVKQDTQQAKEWLHKAIAIAEYGWHFDSIGDAFKTLHDYPNAVFYYQKAAQNDYIGGHISLSKLYATGEGVTQDTQQAKEWLHTAVAVVEDGWDFCEIGDAFKSLNDYPNAILCYEKAAEENDVGGYLSLSKLYATGEGVTQDTQQAKEWLYKAVAIAEYGSDFDSIGDVFKALHDYPNAVLWYQKGAEQSDANAQFSLGELYESGKGVELDSTQAVLWYRKAAKQNHEPALAALERINAHNANTSTPKTNRQKVSECRKAAEQGDALSQFYLGQMYESGKGIPQNYAFAYAWLSVAVANELADATDHASALQLRDEVAQKLPPQTLAEAQQLAAQYFEKYPANE